MLRAILAASLVSLSILSSGSSQTAPPRLIVRADDLGGSQAGNEAILKCCQEGIATSVEVMVPGPWFPDAVKILTAHPKLDVGVHLTLSSEWDTVKWRPLSDCPSLRDADGCFFPMIFPNKNYPGQALAENPWKLEDVEKEFRAQIELARKRLPHVSHLSHHMGCNALNSEVRALVKRLAREYGVDVDPGELDVKAVSYLGPHATSAEKIDSFVKMLESLEAGKIYVFVDHPGLDTPEMRAIHHIGYENVATDRQGVTDTLTNPRVGDVIKAKGIRLIGYRDLKK